MMQLFIALQAVSAYAVIGCVLIAAVNVCARSKPGAQDVFFGLIWPLTLAFMVVYGFGKLCGKITTEAMGAMRRAKK